MSDTQHTRFASPHRSRFLGATSLRIGVVAVIVGLAAAFTRIGLLVPVALIVAIAGIIFGHSAGLRRSGQALVGALLAYVVAAGMVFGVMLPNYTHARSTEQATECARNLRQIDEARQQWAVKNHKGNHEIAMPKDLEPFLPDNKFPQCPAGGTYNIRSLTETPTCSIAVHNGKSD